MHIADILNEQRPCFSFEFFPPKTEAAAEELFTTIAKLQDLHPAYVSVTYGAGGSTRERTHDLIVRIQKETNLTAVSHLTSVCHTLEELEAIVDRYMASGIENILALRGDAPKNVESYDRKNDAFQYAEQLVGFLKDRSTRGGGRGFGIGVAGFPEGHPEMPNRIKEMDYFKRKIDAGADYICTQLFFDNRDFYDFRERCELAGITVPIIAGIMPILTRSGLARMADLALGSRFPARLLKALSRAEDDAATARVGTHWATEQCRDLIDNQVRGIHFYTLNKSDATRQIFENLGVSSSRSLQIV